MALSRMRMPLVNSYSFVITQMKEAGMRIATVATGGVPFRRGAIASRSFRKAIAPWRFWTKDVGRSIPRVKSLKDTSYRRD